MQNDGGETFRTLGLEIHFPYPGYGVQKSMMNHITRTLMNKENSLIESPTGTGKTLVLLCSTLAWLKRSRELQRPFISPRMLDQIAKERLEALENSKCTCGRRINKTDEQHLNGDDKKHKSKSKLSPDDDSNSCCQYESSKYFYPGKEETTIIKGDNQTWDENESPVIILEETPDVEIIDLTADKDEKGKESKPKQPCKTCNALAIEREYSKILTDKDNQVIPNHYKKIPKIYYGTRTHKQVSQVIRELNKSIYKKNLRMCILSSRERTCINESVKHMPNRDEECRELLKSRKDGSGCSYKVDNLDTKFEKINDDFTESGWDIEELNKWGKEQNVCPYFGCRSLQDQADITFCPYNYLLDPKIRRSLKIELKNSIIIFDEAHNIEDICRDSASFILDSKQIDDILTAINIASSHYVQGSNMSDAFQFFRDKFYNLRHFLGNFDFGSQSESSSSFVSRKILSQSEMLNHLHERGLGPDCLQGMVKNLSILREDEGASQESILDLSEVQYISQLTATLEFMYSDGNKNVDDYRCVITKSLAGEKFPPKRSSKKDRSITESESSDSNYIIQMSLLCMSPTIAFKKIHSEAWSVIVASGTLSPIESIQTELGCEFVTPFQGGHVIPRERIMATVLSRGPNGEDLNCSFTNSMSLKFQDAVGLVVRDICKTVPNGVLCFFPSYDRLEGLFQRWSHKGYLGEIKRMKSVHREPKNKSPDEFESELKKYNANANGRGALLLAVYRGKVSEGIDFADNAARAVITIGIPYPNVKEVTIGLKREYNDVARRSKPYLLPGGEWYTSQAFRALNQAVGRCIRHRQDWGAIIMIDSRLKVGDRVDRKISKWLQPLAFLHHDYKVIRDCLENFVSTRLEEDIRKNKRIKLENLDHDTIEIDR